MKRLILTSILVLNITLITAQKECERCDIQKIKAVYENIDKLTYKIINEFLCTFDKSCELNVEYSEWSNEMLFTIIEKNTDLYFEVLENLNQQKKDYLLKEIENPIHDGIDFQKIHDRIKSSNTTEELKNKYLTAMENGVNKSGLKIRN